MWSRFTWPPELFWHFVSPSPGRKNPRATKGQNIKEQLMAVLVYVLCLSPSPPTASAADGLPASSTAP